jgi:hypothetical protein
MTASSGSRTKSIAFGVLGLASTAAGLAAVLTNGLSASVGDARPNGIGGLAKGSVAALRHALSAELAPENGPNIAIKDPARAERLLAAAPLDPTALTYLGLAADKKGDAARARSLMTLAVRSDGRALRPRLWLMDQDLRRRDYRSAIEHFDRLVRIGPAGTNGLINAMTGVVRDPASHAPLARKLATNPPWRATFLYALNQQGVSPNVIYRLMPQDSAKTQVLFEQSALLQSLLKSHEYERAYLAWINFLPEASLRNLGPVYDPQFRKLPGPLPFNWQMTDGADGSSEYSEPRGLTVSYLGTGPATLTEQTMLLSAGRYRLSVIAAGSDDSNQLAWTVTCSGAGEPLRRLPITGLKDARQRYTTQFEIPAADCGAQRLALVGSPVEFPRTASAAMDSVAVELVK